ncbi:MAG: hypothetical protein LBD15_00770 [Holosporales bacterium]|jgi:hypothetical protein|nr:hypothetical protein [Holosporales bacterium]
MKPVKALCVAALMCGLVNTSLAMANGDPEQDRSRPDHPDHPDHQTWLMDHPEQDPNRP